MIEKCEGEKDFLKKKFFAERKKTLGELLSVKNSSPRVFFGLGEEMLHESFDLRR
jgi:hypothetical protein